MSIVIFILILGALIFVHELGHFLAAKKNGIRVDEFAVGFPPTVFSVIKGGTKYSLNLLPIGGYVKIFGESLNDETLDPDAKDSFVNKSKWVQALVLSAGVIFNVIFAWVLFLIVLNTGAPTSVTDENINNVGNPQLVVTGIYPDSPADLSGLSSGDVIESINGNEEVTVSLVQEVIASGETISLEVLRNGIVEIIEISPEVGVIGDVPAIGISMDLIGIEKLSFSEAFVDSFVLTYQSVLSVFSGFGQLVSGEASLNQVSGPVGIVSLVDSAASFGFANVLAFTAFLSINLAVLNIMPFPALDGGRLLFILIESVTRRNIKPVVANVLNTLGFLFLIGFMILITINDVVRLF